MSLKFNIDRPKISDEEIKKNQNFNQLVERFKQQSIKKARGDESWWNNKMIRYSTVIAGVTVICTITYLSLFNNQKQQNKPNETLTTQNSTQKNTKVQKGKSFINAPSQALKIPYTAYKVNNSKGGNIVHASSSKIKIPKNSFVDKNGKDIVGDVTIEYKEFHDLSDVIASGIPMAYDSSGKKYNLETAGMFDIRGSQNGEPVFINPAKKVEVELASFTKEDHFNQYYLDTIERNWKYIKKDHVFPAPVPAQKQPQQVESFTSRKLETLKHEIEKIIPRKIDSVKTVYTTRTEKLPRAKEPLKPTKQTPGKPIFKLDGSYDDYPELSAFDNVVFEVGPENRNYSKELHEITWNDVKVSQGPIKGKNYILTLVYRSRSEKLVVYPVLSGDDYTKAENVYEQNLKKYEDLVEKRVTEEKRLLNEMQAKQAAYMDEQRKELAAYEKEKALMRERGTMMLQNELASNFNSLSMQAKAGRFFQIAQFGVYNSDCPHTVPEGSSVVPSFVLTEKEKSVFPDQILLVDHTNKTVYALDESANFKMNYDPGVTYSICVFSKRKLYLCNKDLFRESVTTKSKIFKVVPLSESADNLMDLKKALEI